MSQNTLPEQTQQLKRLGWLKAHGFALDPFIERAFRADADPLLKEGMPAFVEPYNFETIKGSPDNPGYPFIFAVSGGGKSSLRRRIKSVFDESLGLNLVGAPKVLAVEYIEHDYTLDKATLKQHIARIASLIVNEIKKRLSYNVSTKISSETQARRLLKELVKECRSNGRLDGICVLVDNIDQYPGNLEEGFNRIAPLAALPDLLNLDGVFFKFMLPEDLRTLADKKLPLKKSLTLTIKWEENFLERVLDQRLTACMDESMREARSDGLLEGLCNEQLASIMENNRSVIKQEFVKLGTKLNQPRVMWRLGHHILEEHFRQSYGDGRKSKDLINEKILSNAYTSVAQTIGGEMVLQDSPEESPHMDKRYNWANIRAMLTEGFDAEELRRICYDEPNFKSVYHQLAQNTGKIEIIDQLIEYVNKKLQVDTLLARSKERNPARYEKHQPYYDVTTSPTTSSVTYGKSQRPSEISSVSANDTKFVDVDQTLIYRPKEQMWYAPEFPTTVEVTTKRLGKAKDNIDVVIMTATEVELKAVLRLLTPLPRRNQILLLYVGPETYYLGKFGTHNAVVTKCRMGAISEGSVILATDQAQRLWHPKAVIMTGIAFGKAPEKQKMADVLIASQIISYEQQRVSSDKIIHRGSIPPSNTTLLNRFENVQNWKFLRPDDRACSIHIGPILSGEKLIDNPEFKETLLKYFPQAIGGEMEGAGLVAASGRVGTAWILVKSICDWGDGRKHKEHQPLAAAAAASLVHHVLKQKTILNGIRKPDKQIL